ncbi:MAG: phosphate acyltransferase PlsX [Ruminococcus sp.]|nr:phosphate acyltransferase PlsX [Ruminococcus sp.]
MKIIVDAFGGDNAPLEIIKGAVDAKNEYGVDIILTGDETIIKKVASENNIDITGIEIAHAPDVFSQNEDGTKIREKRFAETSMAKGLRMVAQGEGDAFVSAGNSGALGAGAALLVKRIKGIKRVAFAPVMPNSNGYFMLLDSGINKELRPQALQQFALMGSIYMNKVMGFESPRVGLVNIGTEEHKGRELEQEAYQLLKETPINFIGNVEARDIPLDGCDVAVCDGYTGNMILKTYEGVAMALLSKVKGLFTKNVKTKLAAALVLKEMKELKKSVDYNEVGGAPVLGCCKPVFKAHGTAKAKTIKNAIRVTKDYVENHVIESITQALGELKEVE